MASTSIQVLIQAVVEGLNDLNTMANSIRKVGESADASGAGLDKSNDALKKHSDAAKDAAKHLHEFGASVEGIRAGIGSLVGILHMAGGAFLAFATVGGLKEMADGAARTETLGVTLDIVAKNAGYSKEAISVYEEELKKLGITTSAARNSMVQMIQAGLPLGPMVAGAKDNIAELARASQNLAVVTGENSSATLQRLITNIQQMDTIGLKYMGVIVNTDEAMEKYAASIGKASGALTAQQRQMGFMLEAKEKMKALDGAYEAALETTGKKLQSMSRYQEEAADSIGSILTPAYGSLVDNATKFLKMVQESAEEISKNGELANTLKEVLDGVFGVVQNVANAIGPDVKASLEDIGDAFEKIKASLEHVSFGDSESQLEAISQVAGDIREFIHGWAEALGESAPEIGLLVSSFGMVLDAVADIVKSFSGLSEVTLDASAKVSMLQALFSGLGLLVAGFADGLEIIKVILGSVVAMVAGVSGVIIQGWGYILEYIFPAFGKALVDIGQKFTEWGNHVLEDQGKTIAAFEEGKTHTQAYMDKVKDLGKVHEQVAKQAASSGEEHKQAYEQAEAAVTEFIGKVREGKLAGDKMRDAEKQIAQANNELAKSHKLTADEVAALNQRMDMAVDKSQHLVEAFKTLGTTAEGLAHNTTQAGQSAVQAFNEIEQNGKLAGDKLYQVFSKGIDMSKGLGDLTSFSQAMGQAFKDHKLDAQELASATALVGEKFDTLFKAQLSTSRTQQDFKNLANDVRELGRQGVVSGTAVSTALQSIQDKADGLRQSFLDFSNQQVEQGDQEARIANASLGFTRARNEVQSKQNALLAAENQYSRTGSDLDKARVEQAKAEVNVAQQRKNLAALQYQQEQDSLDLLISKQRLLNATKEQELHIGDATYKAAIQAAQMDVDAKTMALNATKEAVSAQEGVVATTEAAAANARQLADNMEAAANASKNVDPKVATGDDGEAMRIGSVTDPRGTSSSVQGIAALTRANIQNLFKQAGAYASQAHYYANQMLNETGPNGIVAWGKEGVYRYNQTFVMLEQFREMMERDAQSATDFNVQFGQVKDIAESLSVTMSGVGETTQLLPVHATALQQALHSAQQEAASMATSIESSISGFASAALSVHQQLLQATGQETEAVKEQYAEKKKNLDIEYLTTKAKLQSALAEAQASGLATTNLTKAMAELDQSYAQETKDMDTLQSMELKKVEESKRAKQQADRETAEKNKAALIEHYNTQAQLQAKANADARQGSEANPMPQVRSMPLQDVQAIAKNIDYSQEEARTMATQGGGDVPSGKTIKVQFGMDGKNVDATIHEGDETAFLSMLKQARSIF